jgi:hypothetical protein
MNNSLMDFFSRTLFLIPLVFILLLLVSSCTNNTEVKDNDAKAAEALVGVWRGEGTYEDEEDAGWSESWKMVRGSDGSYEVDYIIVHAEDKLYEKSSDAGTWMYEGGIYTEVNGNGDNVIYDVFSVKKDRFEYNIAQRKGSANIEETKTVNDFQLQGPPEGYSEVSYELPGELPGELQEELQGELQDVLQDETSIENLE